MRLQVISLAALAALAGAPATASAQSGSPLSSLFSCAAPGSTNTTGAVIGGIAGAALGSQVSKNERALGAILGAGLGAMAGNWVGCRMQSSSQQRAQAAFETALNTGRSQSWRDSTGAHGRVDVVSSGSGGGYVQPVALQDLRFNPGITRINRPLDPAAATYVPSSRVNVRGAPSISAPVVARLEPNQPVSAAGQIDGFIVLHDRGVVRGYVASSVVRPAAAGPSYAQGDCRTVEQTTTVPGQGTQSARFNACRDPSGQWRVTQI